METTATHDFWHLFRGGMTPAEFGFSLFLVFFGILLYTLVRVWNRQDQSQSISFSKWWNHKDNKLEIMISILIIYPQVIFATVYQGWVMNLLPDSFVAAPFFVMIAGGYLQQYILIKLKKATKNLQA